MRQVAKDSALKFNPSVKIEAYHDNIKESQFNVAWFKTFHVVFNALDNLDARRHVNRMCLAANVPLIESGTTGFNGQVQVIKKVRHVTQDTSGVRELTAAIGRDGMLRLHAQDRTQVLPRLYHPKHALATHPLHSLGQVIPVRGNLRHL
jgi:hypothetical protein